MRLLHPTLYLWLVHIARSLKVFFLLFLLNSILQVRVIGNIATGMLYKFCLSLVLNYEVLIFTKSLSVLVSEFIVSYFIFNFV